MFKCPNLLCPLEYNEGKSECPSCHAKFIIKCVKCNELTPYFSDRCQKCRKELSLENKIYGQINITFEKVKERKEFYLLLGILEDIKKIYNLDKDEKINYLKKLIII